MSFQDDYVWPANSDSSESFAREMEKRARAVLLALGICPEHDLEMSIVEGKWRCQECKMEDDIG